MKLAEIFHVSNFLAVLRKYFNSFVATFLFGNSSFASSGINQNINATLDTYLTTNVSMWTSILSYSEKKNNFYIFISGQTKQ